MIFYFISFHVGHTLAPLFWPIILFADNRNPFVCADFSNPAWDKFPDSFSTLALGIWSGLLHWSKNFSNHRICILSLYCQLSFLNIPY